MRLNTTLIERKMKNFIEFDVKAWKTNENLLCLHFSHTKNWAFLTKTLDMSVKIKIVHKVKRYQWAVW